MYRCENGIMGGSYVLGIGDHVGREVKEEKAGL